MQYYSIKKEEWDKTLEQLLLSYTIFATVKNEFGQDYELLNQQILQEYLITSQNLQLPEEFFSAC